MHIKNIMLYFKLALALLLFINCKKEKPPRTEEKVEIAFKKEGVLKIKARQTDSIIKTLDIEIADNDYETQTGLMYRASLNKKHGMLFIFPDVAMRSFYMKNTKIPLDIIYIDDTKTIVNIKKNAKPFDETSLPSQAPAKYVLEINGGLSDIWQINPGDRIDFKVL